MVYQTVLRKAHQRTFNLKTNFRKFNQLSFLTPEVDEVLRVGVQKQLFDDVVPRPHIPFSNGKASSSAPTVQTEGGA